jgi:hypothetical protein
MIILVNRSYRRSRVNEESLRLPTMCKSIIIIRGLRAYPETRQMDEGV